MSGIVRADGLADVVSATCHCGREAIVTVPESVPKDGAGAPLKMPCGHMIMVSLRWAAWASEMPRYHGWWLRFFERETIGRVPLRARHALTALYKAGYRTIDEVRGLSHEDLLAVRDVGPVSGRALLDFLYEER